MESQTSTKEEDDTEFNRLMDTLLIPLPISPGYQPNRLPKEMRDELNRFRNCPYNITIISEEEGFNGEDPNVTWNVVIEAAGIKIPFEISADDIKSERRNGEFYGRKAVIMFVKKIIEGKNIKLDIHNEYMDISTISYDKNSKTIDILGTFLDGLGVIAQLQLCEKILRFLYDLSSRAYNQGYYEQK